MSVRNGGSVRLASASESGDTPKLIQGLVYPRPRSWEVYDAFYPSFRGCVMLSRTVQDSAVTIRTRPFLPTLFRPDRPVTRCLGSGSGKDVPGSPCRRYLPNLPAAALVETQASASTHVLVSASACKLQPALAVGYTTSSTADGRSKTQGQLQTLGQVHAAGT